MQKCWWSRFELEELRTWSFMVKGINIRSSWTMDPLLLNRFSCSNSVMSKFFVSLSVWKYESLVPVVSGSQSFLLCVCFICMTCNFGLLSLKGNLVSYWTAWGHFELVLHYSFFSFIIDQPLHLGERGEAI